MPPGASTSSSAAATERSGAALTAQLRPGDVVLLEGDLAAGKTVDELADNPLDNARPKCQRRVLVKLHGSPLAWAHHGGGQAGRDDHRHPRLLPVHRIARRRGIGRLRHRHDAFQAVRHDEICQHLPDRRAAGLCDRLVQVHDHHLGHRQVKTTLVADPSEGKVKDPAHQQRHDQPKYPHRQVTGRAEQILEGDI